MLHAKFQSPSIYIDRYFELSPLVRQSLSQAVTQWHTQDVELCTWPEARGTANNGGLISSTYWSEAQFGLKLQFVATWLYYT